MVDKVKHEIMDTLNKLIGIEAARDLALIYGGIRFYFCKTPLCIKRMTKIMGEENALKIIQEFDGFTINIPVYAADTKKERNDRIKADFDAGMTCRDICLNYGLTLKGAQLILNNPD